MRTKVYPSRNGAPGSMNAFTLDGGFTPAFTHFILTMPATTYSPATDRLHYYVAAIETKAPVSTGGQPRQYGIVAKSVFRLDSGTPTDDLINFQSTFDAFNDVVQGAVICDNGSGTPILLVTFGTGNPNPGATSETGIYYRILSSDVAGTAWTEGTAADTSALTACQIIKAGANLFAATDAGRCAALGEWRVSECPSGSDPRLAASWGNGIEVGSPEWIITGMAAIGNAPVIGKPDGLYYYDLQTRRYENVLKHFESDRGVPHALNGKVTQSVTGGVVYTTHDGGVFFFDGNTVNEISPHKLWKLLGKDVPAARITCVADRGDGIAMLPELGTQTTQNAGLVINKVTAAGAATAMTTNLIDGSLATGSGTTLDSLPSGDFIDIWADIPFEAVIFHVTRSPNSTVATVFDQVLYSSATDTFTAASGFIDGTRLTGNTTTATSGGSLSYVAFPPSASSGMVMATDVNFGSLMQKVNFNYASGTDVTQKYGMRIRTSGILDSDTEVDEVEIVPFKPGLPNDVLLTAATNYTPRHRANLTQPVYFLKRKGANTFVPHDLYTVDAYPGTWAMAWHAGRLGQASGGQNMGQSLIGWGRYRTWAISEGPTRNPAQDSYITTVAASSSKPGPVWQFLYDWGGDTELRTIEEIAIDTRFLEPTDKWEVFFQHDERDIKKVAYGEGGPVIFQPPAFPARRINAWLVLTRGQMTNERAPQFLEPVRVTFSVDGDFTDAQDPARSTPLLT